MPAHGRQLTTKKKKNWPTNYSRVISITLKRNSMHAKWKWKKREQAGQREPESDRVSEVEREREIVLASEGGKKRLRGRQRERDNCTRHGLFLTLVIYGIGYRHTVSPNAKIIFIFYFLPFSTIIYHYHFIHTSPAGLLLAYCGCILY